MSTSAASSVAPSIDGIRSPRLQVLLSFASYALLFAVFAAPWLASATTSAPASSIAHPRDERLVLYVLMWVAKSLWGNPSGVLDCPIFFPATGQLTGTEHFATAQLLFAPAYALTDNPVLSANIALFLTYPLAAIAMQRLLLAVGISGFVAWLGGLAFALGPLRVPANLHTLQFANLFLPWVALCLTRLRESPRVGRASWLGVAVLLALFSSYYMAVITLLGGLLWGLHELASPRPQRTRFCGWAIAAVGTAGLAIGLASLPYLRRGASAETAAPGGPLFAVMNKLAVFFLWDHGAVVLFCAAAGLVCVGLAGAPGTTARRGLTIVVVAAILMLGSGLDLGTTVIPLPFALFTESPLAFFRYPSRFVVLMGFGATLLGAAALQAVRDRSNRSTAHLVTVVIVVLLLAERGSPLPGDVRDEFEGVVNPIYGMVAKAADLHGKAPLLELPIGSERSLPVSLTTSMIGSLRHGLPLIYGYTGYRPPHASFVGQLIDGLPSGSHLAELVEFTGVGWILLRPEPEWWRDVGRRTRFMKSPLLRHVVSYGGYDLMLVDDPSSRDSEVPHDRTSGRSVSIFAAQRLRHGREGRETLPVAESGWTNRAPFGQKGPSCFLPSLGR